MSNDNSAWMRTQLDAASAKLTESGVFPNGLVEIKAYWGMPERLLVGKARSPAEPVEFKWFVCGEIPLDHLPGDVAATPRDALRHFSMKWQLDAEKLEGDEANELIQLAYDIYDLADDDRFWPA